MSLPSLDGIKRAVEMGLGVALLPRRCAQGEIARGELVEVQVPELRSPRQVRLVYRRDGRLSHAAQAFLDIAQSSQRARTTAPTARELRREAIPARDVGQTAPRPRSTSS